jgi:hypothetical protein
MDGWRIRHGIEGDVPFFALVILATGAVIGVAAGVVVDVLIHRHKAA